MKLYTRIILLASSFGSLRMIVGSISAVYMIRHGVSVQDLGLMKAMQYAIILFLSFPTGKLIDGKDRKHFFSLAMFFSSLWLFLQYLGGTYTNVPIFFLSEFFNAMSLMIINNVQTTYLIDQHIKENKKRDFRTTMGNFSKFLFLGMSVCAMVGSFLYGILGKYTFLMACFFVFSVFLIGAIALPHQVIHRKTHQPSGKGKSIKRIFFKCWFFVLPIILMGVSYQMTIQFWQIIAEQIPTIKDNTSIFGIIFIMGLLSQSASGFFVSYIHNRLRIVLFFGLMLASSFLMGYSARNINSILLIVSLSMFHFSMRTAHTFLISMVHRYVVPSIRSRFDSVLNMSTTSLSLASVLVLSHSVDVKNLAYVMSFIIALSGLVSISCVISVRQRLFK